MLFIYDSRFDEVFGELVDDLVAVLGDDALVVLDGDLLADAAELVGDRHTVRRLESVLVLAMRVEPRSEYPLWTEWRTVRSLPLKPGMKCAMSR